MSKLAFKKIYKQVEKALAKQPEAGSFTQDGYARFLSQLSHSEYANMAMEELSRYCVICGKKCKNRRGVTIHVKKVHKIDHNAGKLI